MIDSGSPDVPETVLDAEPSVSPLRRAIESLRTALSSKLVDRSRNNPLLYYRPLKVARLELPPPASPHLIRLIAGESVTRPQLFPDEKIAEMLPATGLEADAPKADPFATRLTAIARKARENEEERGLRTLFAGLGMISWTAEDGGRDPLAIAILLPVEIVPDRNARGENVLRRFDGADATLNPALLEEVSPAVAARLRALVPDGGIEDVGAALAAVRGVIGESAGLTYHDRAVLGNFSFQLMAMVQDLAESTELLEAHSLVKAIAGDDDAIATLQHSRDGEMPLGELDRIAPADELFVLDADPWQSQVIHTLAQDGIAHAIVDGPPGTGKSQTIANLVASLIATGKTVLFVAEKRAALDVVRKRLTDAGLGGLVLDLHGSDVTRRQAYAQLRSATAALGSAPPAHFADDDRLFVERRSRLNDHCDFQNAPLPIVARSPYDILGRLQRLTGFPPLRARLAGAALDALTPDLFRSSCELVEEYANRRADLGRGASTLWSAARFSTDGGAAAAVAAAAALRDRGLKPLLADVKRVLGAAPETIADLVAAAGDLAACAELLSFFRPGAFALDDATLDAAIAAHASAFSAIVRLFDASRRAARAAVLAQLAQPAPERTVLLAKLKELRAIDARRRAAAATQSLPDPLLIRSALAAAREASAALRSSLDAPLPSDTAGLLARLDGLLGDPRAPYVAARLRQIEATLATRSLSAVVAELCDGAVPPAEWPAALERVWLESHLDRVRGRIATFDGRAHDRTVVEFGARDRDRVERAGARVLRAAGERFRAVSSAFPQERTALDRETAKSRKLRQLRDLFEAAPNVVAAAAPCVMASPLSVSQFLPRHVGFDFVIFDEGSQVTPENAMTSIVRGRRLVVAGDEHQLPPTAFFTALSDDDGEDPSDENALAGMQSLLDSVKPYAKALGLRVHYRSRDEQLIAFSNHHVYDDRLITFPGTGRDGKAVSYEYVPPTANEADEASSAGEVRAVVARVLDHAEHRPSESLGVITMSIKHAQRVQIELDRVRRDRPDLDAFFNEKSAEPFFVKNLERVQGDERDGIVLSIGYGRTKTGAVSHNFGPVNVAGGERRLNVAITRAKNRILLVSQLRSSDLDPKRLTSRGAKLLGAYLRYAESGGEDLGRDRPHEEIGLNDFEADIKTALERAHGWSIVPQYGVGEFRIDLVVQDPARPGVFVLAIECDGASYHGSPTARLRDRLRQQILELRGWRFLRIWSTDWFNDRDSEISRAKAAYDAALAAAAERETLAATETVPAAVLPAGASDGAVAASGFPARIGPPPVAPPYDSIDDVSLATLVGLIRWIESDERLRTDDELIAEATRLLGFARRGRTIVARLTAAIERVRRSPK